MPVKRGRMPAEISADVQICRSVLVLAALLLAPAAGRSQTPPAQALANISADIPFTKYTLRNGLTLIVNEM